MFGGRSGWRPPSVERAGFRDDCALAQELKFKGFLRVLRGGILFGQKFHFLPHAPANDDVVTVKPRSPAGAVIAGIPRSLSWRENPNHWRAITRLGSARSGSASTPPSP